MKQVLLEKTIDYVMSHSHEERSLGFLTGRMGICFLMYHAYQKNHKIEYKKHADSLLDEVCEHLDIRSLSFESGLVGIGWSVNYLIQQKMILGNTDALLEQIDNALFVFLQKNTDFSLSFTSGLSGFLLYIISRLEYKRLSNRNESVLILEEIFRQIIDKIRIESFKVIGSINKDVNADLFDPFASTIYVLRKAIDLNIYNGKIIIMLSQWADIIITIMPSLHTHRFLLALSLKNINNSLRLSKVDKCITFLLSSIDYERLYLEMNPYSFTIREGWTGFVWMLVLGSEVFETSIVDNDSLLSIINKIRSQHLQLFESYIVDIDKHLDNEFSPPVLNLKNGLGGAILLQMLYPSYYVCNE